MPPLNSWQIMPVPPPTLPSSTAPLWAVSMAWKASSRLHVESVDIVEIAIPGFGHHRQLTTSSLLVAHAAFDFSRR